MVLFTMHHAKTATVIHDELRLWASVCAFWQGYRASAQIIRYICMLLHAVFQQRQRCSLPIVEQLVLAQVT